MTKKPETPANACAPARPAVRVDVLPFSVAEGQLQILLLPRTREPFAGSYALPGGTLGEEESATEAAGRILREKTTITNAHLEQLYTFTRPERDPRERVLSISYLALMPGFTLPSSLREEGARLFTLPPEGGLQGEEGETLPFSSLAFDHGRILSTAIERMRGKLMYTDIAFSLVGDPSHFTLPELQKVYEAILGEKLDPGNFYRRIKRDYVGTKILMTTEQAAQYPRKKAATVYRMAAIGEKP